MKTTSKIVFIFSFISTLFLSFIVFKQYKEINELKHNIDVRQSNTIKKPSNIEENQNITPNIQSTGNGNGKPTLKEADRKKLDGIIQKMIQNKESDENIKFVVNDFKKKYGTSQPKGIQFGTNQNTGDVGGKIPLQEFAQKVKQKYPEYNNVDDNVLVDKIIQKFPEYKNKIIFNIPQTTELKVGINKSGGEPKKLKAMLIDARSKGATITQLDEILKRYRQENTPSQPKEVQVINNKKISKNEKPILTKENTKKIKIIIHYLLAILVYWIPSALIAGIFQAIFLKFINRKASIFTSNFLSTLICSLLIIYAYKLLKFDYNVYILFGLALIFSIWTIYNPSAKKGYDQTNQAVIEASIIAFYKDYLLRNGVENKDIDLSIEHLKIQAGDELRKEALEYADRNALEVLEEQGEYQPHPQFYGVLLALISLLIFFYFQKQQQEISELKHKIDVNHSNGFQNGFENTYNNGFKSGFHNSYDDDNINDKVLNSEQEIEDLKDDLESTKSDLEDMKSDIDENN